jgi:type IV pilus assembly protein PilP
MSTLRVLAWGLLVAAIATGCGSSGPSPAVMTPAAKKAVAAAAAADAGVALDATVYVYSYSPLGKRDPFRSPVEDQQQKSEGSGNVSCSEPLCQWDLDQLKLVAVVTGDANPIAMVEDPQTRGYIIRRGSKVGKQGGQVTQILRDSITVTEYFQSPDGKRNPNAVMMHLKPDAAAVPALDLYSGKTVQ